MQVMGMLQQESWLSVAMFCSYHQQMEHLRLKPWQWPPCWIVSPEAATVILMQGQKFAAGSDISNVTGALAQPHAVARREPVSSGPDCRARGEAKAGLNRHGLSEPPWAARQSD